MDWTTTAEARRSWRLLLENEVREEKDDGNDGQHHP